MELTKVNNEKEPLLTHEGTGENLVLITVRLLEKTRIYINKKAEEANVSTNEYIKQKLGIQTIRQMSKDNHAVVENVIENIYE